jgi:hypothetical protein
MNVSNDLWVIYPLFNQWVTHIILGDWNDHAWHILEYFPKRRLFFFNGNYVWFVRQDSIMMNSFERYNDYVSIWCFVQQFQISKMQVANSNWL